jgi:hypothetical protein
MMFSAASAAPLRRDTGPSVVTTRGLLATPRPMPTAIPCSASMLIEPKSFTSTATAVMDSAPLALQGQVGVNLSLGVAGLALR